MGIFRKKQKITFEGEKEKTPVKFKKGRRQKIAEGKLPRRKKIKRTVIAVVTVLVLGAVGVFGYFAYDAINKMFADGTGILNLLAGTQGQPLKGEAQGRTNILLLGVGDEDHSGATLSDTIIIASIDTKNKYVALFSVPRDLYVKIPGYGYSKINGAHAYGEQNKVDGGGPALAKETVEETFDIPIHYYARVDFSGLEKVVDTLGGVTVDVENEFCDYNYPRDRRGVSSTVCFDKGPQNMNGAKALQYSRSRHAYGVEGSDFARSKRQQRLMLAIKEKALSTNTTFNPQKVLGLIQVLGDHVKTDFQINELARLYELTKDVDGSRIISKNFDNSPEGMLVSGSAINGYTLEPKSGDWDEIRKVIKNIFSTIKVREEKATLTILNGTWNYNIVSQTEQAMKTEGYNVTKTGNADKRTYTKTVIIDYTDGKKSKTIKALEEKFDVSSQKGVPDSTSTDIKIIIGSDYLY